MSVENPTQRAVRITIGSYRNASNSYERRWYAREALSMFRLARAMGVEVDDQGLRPELQEAAR